MTIHSIYGETESLVNAHVIHSDHSVQNSFPRDQVYWLDLRIESKTPYNATLTLVD